MKEMREKPWNHLKGLIAKNKENTELIDTDIDMEKNMGKHTELSTSDSVARKLTQNTDENVNTEEEMDFDDLTITGNYSDYDLLEEEKETITKNDDVWVKTKKEKWRGRVLLIPYSKKQRIVNI